MCMEDIRVGRKASYRYSEVTVPAGTAVQVAAYNLDRISLTFATVSATGSNVSPQGATGSATTGIPIRGTLQPFRIHIEEEGMAVVDRWNAFGGAADSVLSVIETFLEAK